MIKAFSRQYPCTVALALLCTFTLVLALPYLIWGSVDVTEGTGVVAFDALTSGTIWQAMLAAVLVGIVGILGWSDIVGFQGPIDRAGIWSVFWVGLYPLLGVVGSIFALLSLNVASDPVAIIAVVLVLNLLVGLSEEILFRGFVFGALRQQFRLMTAIILSSLAFGMLHLVNLGVGQAISLTMFQVINATALGILFCAIRLQTNSLWPAIFLHMLWNCYVMLGQAVSESSIDQVPKPPQTDLSLINLTLPLVILTIAVLVFRSYVRRTGQSLSTRSPIKQSARSIRA
jgi:membrane protease YdiL (CAAX protease family)